MCDCLAGWLPVWLTGRLAVLDLGPRCLGSLGSLFGPSQPSGSKKTPSKSVLENPFFLLQTQTCHDARS